MMGTHLQQTLKSLCFKTEWKYAVFWKLKHSTRMVLAWEDAYYDNCGRHDLDETLENLREGNYSHDPLELAVAKMSYNEHSLGEGIVGQVAVTGRHQWFFADKHIADFCSLVEYDDGWRTQFSAGIRTIVVVPVVPHGVVQLGSLDKVVEDMKLVTHVRDVFFALQDSSLISSPIHSSMKSLPIQPDLPKGYSSLAYNPNYLGNLDNNVIEEGPNVWLPLLPYFEKHSDSSYVFPRPGIHQTVAVEVVNKHQGGELSMEKGDKSITLLRQRSNSIKLEHRNQAGKKLLNDKKCESGSNSWKGTGLGAEYNATPSLNNSVSDNINSNNILLPAEKYDFDGIKLDGVEFRQNELLHIPKLSETKSKNNMEKLDYQAELNSLETSNTSLAFSAGCELHEALGSGFLKKSISLDWGADKNAGETTASMQGEMSSSKLTFDSGPDHLLEAVVAKFCHSNNDVRSAKAFCKSVQPVLVPENRSGPSINANYTITSSGYSTDQQSPIEEARHHCLSSSEVSGMMSSKGYSSTCPSTCSEKLERSSEPVKNNKRRARPGESCRPRPRDRQLIQDRIKDLRDLVPSGAKCSIDSLLERTIKHMAFLQSIAKHADKLNKCADTKLHHKETGLPGSSSYEQGSSWAVEVGSHLKVCSIIVENLNKNGQMLVEMLCEECSYFLEIAEAIRSLGLTILKGVTEAQGEKTWICFVVEGQENRSIHRMDILWSLVQILQPKTKI